MKDVRRISIGIVLFLIFTPLLSHSALAFSGSGSGTSSDPYVITNWNEWDEISNETGATYQLGNDLNKSTTGYSTVVDSGDGLDPINGFSGTIYGNYKEISDVWMVKGDGTGLFNLNTQEGYANFYNMTLGNFDITGYNGVGGLIGNGDTDYSGSGATLHIENIKIKNSTIEGDSGVGGIIGDKSSGVGDTNNLTVENSEIYASNGNAGGIAGKLLCHGDISEHYKVYDTKVESAGSNVGGAVGLLEGYSLTTKLVNSYSVNSYINGSSDVGGLIGRVGIEINSVENVTSLQSEVYGDNSGGVIGTIDENTGNFINMYSDNWVDTTGTGGGVIGYLRQGYAEKLYSAGKVNKNASDGGGIVGRVGKSSETGTQKVENSYYDHEIETDHDAYGSTEPYGNVNNLVGLNTSEMQGGEAIVNMGSLNFGDVWESVESEDSDVEQDNYPILKGIDRSIQVNTLTGYRTYETVETWDIGVLVSNKTVVEKWELNIKPPSYEVVERYEIEIEATNSTLVETWNIDVSVGSPDVVETWNIKIRRSEMVHSVEEWKVEIQTGNKELVESWKLEIDWGELDPFPILFKVMLIVLLFGFIGYRMSEVRTGKDVAYTVGYIIALYTAVVVLWYFFPPFYEWALIFLG